MPEFIQEDYYKLFDLLVLHEDVKLKPYRCTSGKLTIGVGRNLDDKGISRGEALTLLDNDIDECLNEAYKYSWFHGLNSVRKAVVLDMMFNMGAGEFPKNWPVFQGQMAREDWTGAVANMEGTKWHKQVGTRAVRLEKMMLTGEWPDDVG